MEALALEQGKELTLISAALSSMSATIASTPSCCASFRAFAAERVTALTVKIPCFTRAATTPPPCDPLAPKTAIIGFAIPYLVNRKPVLFCWVTMSASLLQVMIVFASTRQLRVNLALLSKFDALPSSLIMDIPLLMHGASRSPGEA